MYKMHLLIVLLFASTFSISQSQWKSFNSENGLAGDYARKHLVCQSGDVWLLTGQTINIYDGNGWTIIDQVKDGVTGVQHLFKEIIYMDEDPNGHVWLGTKTGLFEYDGEQWQFHKERWNKKFGWQGFTIRYFSMDAQGYVWAFLEKVESFPTDFTKKWTIGLMYRYTGEEWEIYPGVAGRTAMNSSDKSKHFKAFFTDKYNNFWVMTYDGFCIWNGSKWKMFDGINYQDLDCYTTDKEGNTWLGNKYRLMCYNGNDWTTYKKKDGLAATWVYALRVDEQNRVWALTRSQNYNMFKGLSFYKDGKWTSFPYKKDDYVFPILYARDPGDGNLWMGSKNAISVYSDNGWITYTTDDGLVEGEYKWVIKDRNENIWACSDNKYLLKRVDSNWVPYFEEESADKNWWFSIRYTDEDGNIWLGVNDKGMYRYDGDSWSHFSEENELISNAVKRIFDDNKGNVWFVSEDGVSVYFDQQN